uniref:G-protein coupled receptors family 1 profile domain-containing protein n=1 Tax=Ditylenchus dipsaci TaxID=166011 RepID=A0A915CW34_9BILA
MGYIYKNSCLALFVGGVLFVVSSGGEEDYGGGSSCTQGTALLDQPQIRVTVICAYLFVFSVCLLGNMFTIIVICVHRSMRTATNFFLANLALADLLVAVFCILQNMFHVVGSSNAHWPLGAVVCKLYVLVLHLVPCTGIGILLRLGMALTIWAVSLVCNLPYYFTTRELRYGTLSACVRDMREDSSLTTKHIITISFVVWYCIPLTSIAFLNDSPTNGTSTAIAPPSTINDACLSPNPNYLNNSSPSVNGGSKVHEAAVVNTPIVPTIAVTNTANNTDLLESRKKIIRLLTAIVCSFATLTLPHHARLLYVMWIENDTCTSSWSALLQPATYLSLFLSSSVNPFLYAFMSQRFRAAVRDIINCRAGKTQRKYTRTRTLLSDCPSRSPSLTRLHTGHASSTNLSLRKNNSSNFLSHLLHVHNGNLHSGSHLTLHDSGRVKTKLIRSESGEPLTNCMKNNIHVRCSSGDCKKEKKAYKSLYRNTRI